MTTLFSNGAAPAGRPSSDSADQMTKLENRLANGNSLSAWDYAYDGAGNRTSETGRAWTYDAINQLTVEDRGGALTTYQYDAVGNRTLYMLENSEGTTYREVPTVSVRPRRSLFRLMIGLFFTGLSQSVS